jgi:DNA-binding response OmpR family regulator
VVGDPERHTVEVGVGTAVRVVKVGLVTGVVTRVEEEVLAALRGRGVAVNKSLAMARRESVELFDGVTPLATRATAANEHATATPAPASHTPVSIKPRRTRRLSPNRGVGTCKRKVSPSQIRAGRCQFGRVLAVACSMPKVLLVEDDDRVRLPLVHSLVTRGHLVTEVSCGLPALQSVVDAAPDVVVLDLGLPDIDGGDLLKMLRAVSTVPLIIATARDDEREIVRLLDAGADDYIVKPFSAEQVDARIRALLRRTSGDVESPVTVGELVIDPAARTVTLKGEPLELSRKEFDLLLFLARRPGTVVTKQELLTEIWGQPFGGTEKTVDTHLSWLRAKLGETANAPRYLRTVRGVGIKLVVPN